MKTKVILQSDLEARTSANLVQKASQYESKIYIVDGSTRVNAKSIMGMMSLSLRTGKEIVLDIEGADERDAAENMADFLRKL